MVIVMTAFTSSCLLHMRPPQVHIMGSRTLVQAGVLRTGTITRAGEQIASGGGHTDPPKLEPFSQSRLNRAMRERSFLQKAEEALNDRCMALEGEEAWQCWEALFDYEHMKDEVETECNIAEPADRDNACRPLERFENMVRQSGGVNSLIDNVRMVALIKESKKQKAAPDEEEWLKAVSAAGDEVDKPSERVDKPSERHEVLEDGGIPKTLQEMQEEVEAMLPESAFTRVLKSLKGHHID